MTRFRHASRSVSDSPPGVGDLLGHLFRPCHFYLGDDTPLTWDAGISQVVPWEVYQGRLVDPRHTRQRRAFRAWGLLAQESTGAAPWPVVGLKWDVEGREVHVVRALLSHTWESYDAGGNVIESRPTTCWLPELVGTLALDEFGDLEELRDELICRLWQAVVGTSRLPLTSLEAPLPGFTLGRLAYVYRAGATGDDPLRNWRELIDHAWLPELAWREQAKLLEVALRAAGPDEIPEAAARIVERWKNLGHPPRDLARLLKTVFNDVSLSPWTRFVDKALAWAHALVELGEWPGGDEADFLSWLLRRLSRHLTAYDLVTFHHAGANYPDALLLDAALQRLLGIAEREPELFRGTTAEAILRRRAVRHGVLLRRAYEGHAVPDAPTSPGENARVLPEPFVRVPQEQLDNPLRRERRLFAEAPLAVLTPTPNDVFRLGLEDLAEEREQVELGMATFIDRPLGLGKAALEPDQTPLFAHEAFSRALAQRRLEQLAAIAHDFRIALPGRWPSSREDLNRVAAALEGVPIQQCTSLGRPVAALADARRASDDFVVVRTLPSSLRALRELFDWSSLCRRFVLDDLWSSERLRCVRVGWGGGGSAMTLQDDTGCRVLFEAHPSQGFRSRGGVELPVAGLRIWEVRDDRGERHDLRGEQVNVPPHGCS